MPHILIVDDEADTCDLLGRFLVRHGYTVECAHNGWEALLEVDRRGFDLILLDIMMPGLDGPKFLNILRGHASGSSIPVLVVTALDRGEAEQRLRDGSAQGVVEKKGHTFYDDLLEGVRMIVGSGGAPMN